MTAKYLLAAHIGGTKARFGLLDYSPQEQATKSVCFRYRARYPIGDFPDATSMVNKFIKDAENTLRSEISFGKACLAIAGPIEDSHSKIASWDLNIDGDRLNEKFGGSEFYLINDFQAVAYGIKELGKESTHKDKERHFHCIQQGEPQENGVIAVIGAATGLGKSFLVQLSGADEVQAYPTEGGHTNFAPRSRIEFVLLQYILKNIKDEENRDLKRVSVERLVSGRGILAIYSFLRDCQDDSDDDYLIQEFLSSDENPKENLKEIVKCVRKEVKKKIDEVPKKLTKKDEEESRNIRRLIKTWQEEDNQCRESVDPAAMISVAALRKSDPLCIVTMQMFLEIYAAEVGNFALQFLPNGGLYVAGGITPQILKLIEEEKDERKNNKFLAVLSQKGRLSNELQKIPIYALKTLEAGLIGAAYYVRRIT